MSEWNEIVIILQLKSSTFYGLKMFPPKPLYLYHRTHLSTYTVPHYISSIYIFLRSIWIHRYCPIEKTLVIENNIFINESVMFVSLPRNKRKIKPFLGKRDKFHIECSSEIEIHWPTFCYSFCYDHHGWDLYRVSSLRMKLQTLSKINH